MAGNEVTARSSRATFYRLTRRRVRALICSSAVDRQRIGRKTEQMAEIVRENARTIAPLIDGFQWD